MGYSTNIKLGDALAIDDYEVSRICNGHKYREDINDILVSVFEGLYGKRSSMINYFKKNNLHIEIDNIKLDDINSMDANQYNDFIKELVAKAFTNSNIELDDVKELKFQKFNDDFKESMPKLQESLPPVPSYFLGRDDEIEEIQKKFLNGGNIIFLTGMGGIGKSYIALKYARKYESQYDIIQHAYFEKDLINTIKSLEFKDIDESLLRKENESEVYAKKLNWLKQHDEETLLIIDNMDQDIDDLDLTDILDSNCRIIITSRNAFDRVFPTETIKIKELKEEEQIELFKLNCVLDVINDEDRLKIKNIIKKVQGHTLAIELIARAIVSGDMEIDEMIDKLASGMNSIDEEITISKDSKIKTALMYPLIASLFDIQSFNNEEKEILTNMCLIPLSGISKRSFKDFLMLKNANNINGLVTASWISTDNTQRIISLHPVINEVLINTLLPDFNKCKVFLNSVLKNTAHDDKLCNLAYHAISKCSFDYALDNSAIEYLIKLAETLFKNFYIKNAVDVYEKARSLCEKAESFDKNMYLLKIYEDIGYAYLKKADYNKSIENYRNALKHASDEGQLNIARLYNSIGFVFRKNDNHDEAIKNLFSALEIRKRELEPADPDLGTTYNDIGLVYLNRREYSNCEKYYKKALKIREKNSDSRPLDLAFSYNNLGTLFREKKEYSKSLEFYKKALEIREKVLGDSHLDVAQTVNNIGVLYEKIGEYADALENYEKALEIREGKYSFSHPDLAWSYHSIASVYMKMKNPKSVECAERALRIRYETIGENHSYTIKTQFLLAKVYYNNGNLQSALEQYRIVREKKGSVPILDSNKLLIDFIEHLEED